MAADVVPGRESQGSRDVQPGADVLLKKQLRTALGRARAEAGLTQKATAEKLDWSVSKVLRIEQGAVPVSPTDVRAMLHAYDVLDVDRVEGLVGLARRIRDLAKEQEDMFADLQLSQPFRELIAQEQLANVIWKYEPRVVPGYFQTDSYARGLLDALGHTPEGINRRAQLRHARQVILELEPGPQMHVIIGEVALLRPVGGVEVMREQLRRLVEISEIPTIDLHVLPLSAGVHRGMGLPFTVLQFDRDDIDDALYLEDADRRSTARVEAGAIADHLERFNELLLLTDNSPFGELVGAVLEGRYG